MRYEAFMLPRGNVVVDVEDKHRHIEAELATMDEARFHAQELNRWLEHKPVPNREFRTFSPPLEPTQADLLTLIDSIYEPERRLQGLESAVHKAAKAGREHGFDSRRSQKRVG